MSPSSESLPFLALGWSPPRAGALATAETATIEAWLSDPLAPGTLWVLQLYDRWVRTGSRRAAALLAEMGITPVAPGDVRPQ